MKPDITSYKTVDITTVKNLNAYEKVNKKVNLKVKVRGRYECSATVKLSARNVY